MLKFKVEPAAPKIITGFHGGGGACKVGEKWTPTGCLCGALAAGVLLIGYFYGRTSPKQPRFGCASEVSNYLHRRFEEELGAKCCAIIKPFYQKMDKEKSCAAIYQKGAELTIEALLSAPKVSSQCEMPKTLQTLARKALHSRKKRA